MWLINKRQQDYPELKDELLALCREWFQKQMRDLPEDELPAKEEIETDMVRMRDEIVTRIVTCAPAKNLLKENKVPDDEGNKRAIAELVEAYSGHEDKTPFFTTLALSKINEPRYQSGWPLCTIRLIAEAWLEQSVT